MTAAAMAPVTGTINLFRDFQSYRALARQNEELRAELRKWVRKEIGPIASPDLIQWAPGLPKTRSGKIMRRILRKIAADEIDTLGDTSTVSGGHNNRAFREAMIDFAEEVPRSLQDALFDPQTSGGLCIAVAADSAKALVDHLQSEGVEYATIFGEVVESPAGRIQVA